MIQSEHATDYLQIWGIESGFSIFKDGSIGFGLDLTPVDVTCDKDECVNEFAEQVRQFINGLPTFLDIQFVQEIESGNESMINAHHLEGKSDLNELSQALLSERVEILRKKDRDSLIPSYKLKVFVRKKMAPLISKRVFFSKPFNFENLGQDVLDREIKAMDGLKHQLMREFSRLGLPSKEIEPHDLFGALYRQWNPCRESKPSQIDFDDLNEQVVQSDIILDTHFFSIGEMEHQVLSLKTLPDQTYSAMASVLKRLPFSSKLYVTFHVPDQQKEIESLQTQRRIAYSMARGKKSGVADLDSEAKFQDLETLLSELIAQGEKVFKVSVHVVLRSKSRDELRAQAQDVVSLFREMGGAEVIEETLPAFELFSEFCMPNARSKERTKSMKSSTLSDFLPLYGPWRGHDKPSILLRSRMGSLIAFDPFSPNGLTNYNHVISGGSGSGKSFLTNLLLLQMLKDSPKIYIVDIGGSYKKLCEQLNGQYIPLGVGSGYSLNPFDLAEGEKEPSAQKIKFLVGLVELMTKEEDETRLPKLERAEIEESIFQVFEKSAHPRVSELRDELSKHEEIEIRRYSRILNPWCGNTPFGEFVDQKTNLELNRPIVCFDLKGLENYPDLQKVCLYIITDFVWREVQKDRSNKKFLVFDECWKLLENDAGSTFIAEVFRTFRKYFAGAIAISQNMDDFAKSKVAGAILSNSATKWCLSQKGADQERLREVLSLNNNELALISSLSQERGVYSEAFLMTGDHRSVVSIEATPLEYWIATTDPRDLSELEKYKIENPGQNTASILKILSSKYPRGVATASKN
ncbi:MAG: ATP-binding protein [Xanthomonadaceae bacterium]|nr:ATP-binding protein [Xanthomonadaceae bacterium]